ncbi:MAG: hypothetical protein NTZ05_16635 [Chloroflexi bacterium]|nr:hypothetical protein [Chloroflexota bacterium]
MRHRPHVSVMAALVALLAIGCGGSAPAAAPAPASAPAGGSAAAPAAGPAPAFTVVSPADKAEVAGPDVKIETTFQNYTFGAPGAPIKAGEGHVHVVMDGSAITMIYEKAGMVEKVKPGPHTFDIELVRNDHVPLDPPVKKTVTVTVK